MVQRSVFLTCRRATEGSFRLSHAALAVALSGALAGCQVGAPDGSLATLCVPQSHGKGGGSSVCQNIDTSSTGSLSGSAQAVAEDPDKVVTPTPDRTQVRPQLASATPELMDSLGAPDATNSDGTKKVAPRQVAQLTISDAVAAAVLSHPLMGAAAARVSRTGADVDAANSAFKPTLSLNTGTGWATLGQYSNYPVIGANGSVPGTWRTDIGLSFRQLVYDFGAAHEEVERNKALMDSEKLKLADQAEDIALRTVNAYLNLLEQQELLGLSDQTIAAEHKLADLVKLNQQNGNAASSDVDRIASKIIEIEAMRSDVNSAYRIALDEFRRLTAIEPKQVRRPNLADSIIPKNVEDAIKESKSESPAVLAIRANSVSLEHQFREQEAQGKPHIDFEADATVKHYQGVPSASIGVIDNRAMFVVNYKIFDGGLQESLLGHIRASQEENRFSELDQMESLELNIRRFYETIAADRIKREAAQRGVVTAEKVNQSYTEQFKAGKRTVFEVLDSYTSIFTMKKNAVNGEYEALRSEYGILRNLGRLNRAIVSSPDDMPKPGKRVAHS